MITPPGSVVLAWNNIYLDLVRKIGGAPGPLARIGGLMHWAMYEAANGFAASPGSSRLPAPVPTPQPGADPRLAAAYAACFTLTELIKEYVEKTIVGNQGGVLNPFDPFQIRPDAALYAHSPSLAVAGSGDAAVDEASSAYGQAVASAVKAAHDASAGFDMMPAPDLAGATPGEWRPTGSGPALTPNWGKVPLLFVGEVGGEYVPEIIPAHLRSYESLLKSPEYAMQLAEVQLLGEAHSQARTREQTEIAFFWANDLNGTSKPPGQLYAITQTVAQLPVWEHGGQRNQRVVNNLLETARLFAMVGTAMINGGIVAWHSKYFWPGGTCAGAEELMRLWRPETAIHRASEDGNPGTNTNALWQPLSATREGTRFSPNFPAFVSGHSAFGAAHAAAMQEFFGRDEITFTATTEDPHALRDENGVRRTRQFHSFTQAALENGRSRVYLGVHYQFDANGGYQIGTAVGKNTAVKFKLS